MSVLYQPKYLKLQGWSLHIWTKYKGEVADVLDSIQIKSSSPKSSYQNLGIYIKKVQKNQPEMNIHQTYHTAIPEFQESYGYHWYLLIFFTNLFTYLRINQFICFIYFSLSLIWSYVFNLYFTYLLFPLPCLIIYYVIIMYPQRYLRKFLTCSSLCYNIIIYLIFLYFFHIN